MAKKILLVVTTVATALAAGQTFGGKYLFKLGEQAQIVDAPQAQFDDVAAGTYAGSCQALDASNAPLGDAVTVDVVVPEDDATGDPGTPPAAETYPAPSSLSFQIVS